MTTLHTCHEIHRGDHGSRDCHLGRRRLIVFDELHEEDSERVADAVDDEIDEEGGSDDRPAPAAVRGHGGRVVVQRGQVVKVPGGAIVRFLLRRGLVVQLGACSDILCSPSGRGGGGRVHVV